MADTSTPPGPIVARIRDALIERGIPSHKVKKEIMNITGVSKQNLTHWFNGQTTSPSATHLYEIAKAHDLDLEWLIVGELAEPTEPTVVPINRARKHEGIKQLYVEHAENVYADGIAGK